MHGIIVHSINDMPRYGQKELQAVATDYRKDGEWVKPEKRTELRTQDSESRMRR